jgi:hypothetical protein
VVCSGAARDEWVSAGLFPDRVVVAAPPVEDRETRPAERGAIRRRLGLSPGEIALLMIGRGPHADGVRFVLMHGVLGIAGTRFTGVFTREAGQFARGIRYFLSAPPKNRLIVSDHAASRLLPGMDAAIFDGGGYGPSAGLPARPAAGTMAIAAAHAAGVPVVAPSWAGDERLYPADGAGSLLAHNGAVLEIARVLTPLIADRGALAGLGRRVREHLASQGPDAAFASAIDAMWARASGRAQAAPAAAPRASRAPEGALA